MERTRNSQGRALILSSLLRLISANGGICPAEKPRSRLNLNSKTARSSLVMRELGESHEADALIGILFEYGDLLARLAAGRLSRDEFTKIGDPVPGGNALLDRLEQVRLFVYDGLLLERRHDPSGTGNHRVIKFPTRLRHRPLLQHALVTGHNGGDVLTGREPGSKEHGNIAAGGETDQVGAVGDILRGIDGNDSAPDLRLHSFPESRAVFRAAAIDPRLFDAGTDGTKGHKMAPRLAAGTV